MYVSCELPEGDPVGTMPFYETKSRRRRRLLLVVFSSTLSLPLPLPAAYSLPFLPLLLPFDICQSSPWFLLLLLLLLRLLLHLPHRPLLLFFFLFLFFFFFFFFFFLFFLVSPGRLGLSAAPPLTGWSPPQSGRTPLPTERQRLLYHYHLQFKAKTIESFPLAREKGCCYCCPSEHPSNFLPRLTPYVALQRRAEARVLLFFFFFFFFFFVPKLQHFLNF